MVNRITFVEVADDDTLSAGYFNDLRSKTLLNRDSSAQDTTEYSATIGGGLDWVDLGYSKTFTPIDGVNNILKSLNVEWDLKVDSIASIYRVKIVNDTTSEIFYAYNAFGADDAGIETQTLDRETSTTYNSSSQYSPLLLSSHNATANANVISQNGVVGGATYTITIEAQRSAGSGTSDLAYVKNITVTLNYNTTISATQGWA